MPQPPRRRRPALTAALGVLCLLLPTCLPPGPALAAPPPADEKISGAVRAELEGDDKAVFWVRLRGEADLAPARRAGTRGEKARRVYAAKTEHARASQARLIELLKAEKAEYTSYWIANAVRVTGDAKLAAEIAGLTEVARIEPVRTVTVPEPAPGRTVARVNAVEWNVDRINAPAVWAEYADRGEGIVVATIDTGAQFDHPELAASYRGTRPEGPPVHDYNWFDPARACPAAEPCDNVGHGTHVTGTIAGANGIGVAPGVRWIAAKGCETDNCTDASLLAAGQWVLAPTDLNGENPRPDLAPHVVNNSWGGDGFDPWYQTTVDAWVAAGIFPMFANGNEGPGCRTSGTPGQYANSYSAGGFDVNNALYSLSSKGEAEGGEIKPNIAAPGVDVRSAVPGDEYEVASGTSMASPHVAATVALLWSAVPRLQGDVTATRGLLDGTAIDVADTSCGGTAADNNVWGEGRLDALAAVRAAPHEPLGELRGTVTANGAPLAAATLTLTGPLRRTVDAAGDGTYAVPRLLPGAYEVTVTRFGHRTATLTVTLTGGETTTADVDLPAEESGVVSGTVRTAGAPEAGATVTAAGTPVSAVTDEAGRYSLTLPHGSYDLRVTPRSRCSSATTVEITVAGDLAQDVELPLRGDDFGYTCVSGVQPYVAGTERLALTGDDEAVQVTLPFPVPFYGAARTSAWISTNGFATFAADRITAPSNGTLPSAATPNLAVYPYWDDLVVDGPAGVHTAVTGTAPRRTFVIEWRDVRFFTDAQRMSFAALLGEDGSIGYRYRGVDSEREQGTSATVGIENDDGTDALRYSADEAAIADGQGVTFTASRHGLVTGAVTDANDGDPLPGATVRIGDVATLTTGPDGVFSGQVLAGDHEVEVSAENYGTVTRQVTVTAGTVNRLDFALITGRVTASAADLEVILPADATRTRTVELTNLGEPTAYTVAAEGDGLSVSPASGELARDASVTLTVTVSSAGARPGDVRRGRLLVRSASGRRPVITVGVTAVVPRLQVAVDAAGPREVTDAEGDAWTSDRRYATGSHGYVATGTRTHSTTRRITGTADQELFRRARENMLEYRFDGIPSGTYTVELGFAETRPMPMGERVFDVIVEGQLVIPALDLALEAGTHTAVVRRHTLRVTDGQLNIRFATRQGSPTVSLLRVSHRPDQP